MLRRLLIVFSSMTVAYAISKLLQQHKSLPLVKKKTKSCRKIRGEDKISSLPDDLLVHILSLVSTKDAVRTMILSKRWQYIWTMVPELEYVTYPRPNTTRKVSIGRLLGRIFGRSNQQQCSIWRFINKSLQLHKAHVLDTLIIQLGTQPPGNVDVNIDITKWIMNAVNRKVCNLVINFAWSLEPIRLSTRLYTCNTLVGLYLCNKILVDVPSSACLPSLHNISLFYVVYKDEDSLVTLLSNCPVLTYLGVIRGYDDNVTNFIIKVPTLEYLFYGYYKLEQHNEGIEGSLVIDCPSLKNIYYIDFSGDSCSLENKPLLDKATISVTSYYLDDKFMRSLSSVTSLELGLSIETVAWTKTMKFSKLMACKITPLYELDWLESLIDVLQNSPNLKVLCIDLETYFQVDQEGLLLSWTEPSSVPKCLSDQLEIFEWKGYRGRNEEKEAIRYIFANSKCLKRIGISMKSAYKLKYGEKMMKEFESMFRVSTSSQLLFSTQLKHLNFADNLSTLLYYRVI